jgi:tetratricopeptide (TPR) repeat protein
MKTYLILLAFLPTALFAQTLQKAKTLYETGKPAEAVKLLEAINEESKEYAEAQFYLGRIAYDKKEYDDASDYFEEATEANEKNSLYFEWLGNTYGMIARDANVMRQGFLAPKMKDAWEKAVALDPKNIGARLSLIEFYMQAPGFMGGSVDKAVETAKQIIKLDAARGHRALAGIYDREKKTAEAEKEYIAMVAADATTLPILINFYIIKNDYDKAFKLVDVEIQKKPDDMLMQYQYAKLSALSGKNLDRGEQYLKKYFTYTPKENEPSHAGAYMRLGMIYEKRGNKAEAKKNYQTALQLDKKLKEAEDGLGRVSK